MGVKKIKRMVDVMRKFEKAITPKRSKSAFQVCMSNTTVPHHGVTTPEQRKENRDKFKANAKACKGDASNIASKNNRLAKLKLSMGI